MTRHSQYAIGTVLTALLAGGAFAAAAAPGDQQASTRAFGKHAMFQQYDTNNDGKITQAEIDAVLAKRFAEASGGKTTLTKAQFETLKPEHRFEGRSESMFKKIDWNADGKVDREEFLNAQRARFNMMDRKGTGEVSCAPREKSAATPDADTSTADKNERKGHWRGHHGMRFGAAGFCAQYDANKDGKVTRAEFDQLASAKFDKFAKAGALTQDGFKQISAERKRGFQDKRFDRLDANHDGTLTLSEFSAPETKMFTHLDKDKKGYVTKDDLKGAMHHHRFQKGDRHGDMNKGHMNQAQPSGAQTPE